MNFVKLLKRKISSFMKAIKTVKQIFKVSRVVLANKINRVLLESHKWSNKLKPTSHKLISNQIIYTKMIIIIPSKSNFHLYSSKTNNKKEILFRNINSEWKTQPWNLLNSKKTKKTKIYRKIRRLVMIKRMILFFTRTC